MSDIKCNNNNNKMAKKNLTVSCEKPLWLNINMNDKRVFEDYREKQEKQRDGC